MKRLADIAFRSPIARFILAGLFIFAALALTSSASILILLFNDLLMAGSAGVCWAYASVVPEALTNRKPTKGEYHSTGVFLVLVSSVLLRVASTVGRDLGWPEIYNTIAIPFALLIGFMGALLLLWAPEAIEGRVPRERKVFSGALVAAGTFVALASWTIKTAVLVEPVTVHLR